MTKSTILASLAAALLLSLPAISATTAQIRNSWPPETLTGKIMMVNPDQKLVVVRTANGVPFDMVVKPSTRIDQGAEKIDLPALAQDVNRPVSVRFVPERSGDIARSIEVNP